MLEVETMIQGRVVVCPLGGFNVADDVGGDGYNSRWHASTRAVCGYRCVVDGKALLTIFAANTSHKAASLRAVVVDQSCYFAERHELVRCTSFRQCFI